MTPWMWLAVAWTIACIAYGIRSDDGETAAGLTVFGLAAGVAFHAFVI